MNRSTFGPARILIVTRWFPPEQAPFGQMMRELADSLVLRGYDVDVITSVPSHPSAVVFDGWRNRLLRVESPAAGLRVFRIGTIARNRARGATGRPVDSFVRSRFYGFRLRPPFWRLLSSVHRYCLQSCSR